MVLVIATRGRTRIVKSRDIGDPRPLEQQRFLSSAPSSSRRKGAFYFRKRFCFQRVSILVIHCLLSFCCRNNIFFQDSKRRSIVSAWEMTPSVTSSSLSRSSRQSRPIFVSRQTNRIRQHRHFRTSSTEKRTILELSSSNSAEKDPNNDTSTGTSSDTEKANQDDEVRWRANVPRNVYASPLLWQTRSEWKAFMKQFQDDEHEHDTTNNQKDGDHLWEQVKLEALSQLSNEPEAGPQLYQSILSQGSLVEAIVSIIARTYT